MEAQWLARTGSTDLLLIFGGWAIGAAPFQGLTGRGDVLFLDDYRQIDLSMAKIAGYQRVDLVGFSFGVAAAGHWMTQTGFTPDSKTAINGSLSPVDMRHGIAPEMVAATADNLSVQSFARFCRRAGYLGAAPEIDIPACQSELRAVIARGPAPAMAFDRVWIAEGDRIMPAKAQRAAWSGLSGDIRSHPGPHIPFQSGQSWEEWVA